MSERALTGQIVKKLGNVAYVQTSPGGEPIPCNVRGRLKLGDREETSVACIGDFVDVLHRPDGSGSIEEIHARKTLLARSSVLTPEIADPIMANADILVIVVGVNPVVKPGIIDRYLVAGETGGLKPVIVLNKIDLPAARSEREKLRVYRSLGLAVIETSAKEKIGIEGLKEAITGATAVFCGHSGVGKSSLLNVILGSDIKIAGVALKTMKGKHTTSHSEMYANPDGGAVIDTPGIKSFGVIGIHSDDVIQCFPEIFEASRSCEYRDCRHIYAQSGCAVMGAVKSGTILESRYESWQKLKAELAEIEFY